MMGLFKKPFTGGPGMHRRRQIARIIGRHFTLLRKSQRTTLCALAVGLSVSRRLGLASIARGMLSATSVRHRIKRVWRFASNEGICLQAATVGMVNWLTWVSKEPLVVALDWTDLPEERRMLMAAATVCGRAVPLAWTVMHRSRFTPRRRSQNEAEEQLILRLKEAIGDWPWVLVADRGFARADLFAKLQRWGIRYVIRAASNVWVRTKGFSGRLGNVARHAGMARLYRDVRYQKTRQVRVNLVLVHREPAPEPWYLVTNVEGTARRVEKLYRRRMWIEECLRDAKSGMGLGKLWLARVERIERLLIVMAVVMMLAVVVALSWRAEHGGKDPQLSTKRRGGSLSIFRLGMEWIRQHGLPPGIAQVRLPPTPENVL